MKNYTKKPFTIKKMSGVDFLGYTVTDTVNNVEYQITEEPLVSVVQMAEAAYENSGGSDRQPIDAPLEVLFIGDNPANMSYFEELGKGDIPTFTSVDEMKEFFFKTSFRGNPLHVYFVGQIPDVWFYTDRFDGCSELHLHFCGLEAGNGSDPSLALDETNACISKCNGVRVFGPVTTYVDGAIVFQPSDVEGKGLVNLFYTENSYIIFEKIHIKLLPGNWEVDASASFPAIFLCGMNSKMEFNDRFILILDDGGSAKTRTFPGAIIETLNYGYFLFNSYISATIRHADASKLWTFTRSALIAERYSMLRLMATEGGYLGKVSFDPTSTKAQLAQRMGLIETSVRMTQVLVGSGMTTVGTGSGGVILNAG